MILGKIMGKKSNGNCFSQRRHEIPASVALAEALVARALFLAFAEHEAVFQYKPRTVGKALDGGDGFGVFVVLFQYPLQVLVGGAAGLDVLKVLSEGGEHVVWENGIRHERREQRGKTGLPLCAVGLNPSRAITLIHIIMRHFVDVGDEHLVGVQVEVEGDGTEVVLGSWRTEVAELRGAWPLEVETEAALLEDLAHHRDGGFGEIALQQLEFFRLHRGSRVRIPWLAEACSSTWCRCCSCAGRDGGPALPWSCMTSWP